MSVSTLTVADLVATVQVKHHRRPAKHVTRQVLSHYRGDVEASIRRDQAIFGVTIRLAYGILAVTGTDRATTEYVRWHAPHAIAV